MIHAITFTDPVTGISWNTRDDWGLALTTQPTFQTPPTKTKYLDLPGGNGVIDLTTAITGYPVYGDRTGSFTFVAPVKQAQWQPLLSEIAEALHGQAVRIILDDDPGWYYEGRVSLNIDACERQYATVVINYDVGPFKWAITATNEPWLWDPFSFVDGVIGNGTFAASFSASASVTDTAAELAYTAEATGDAFFFPSFTVTGDSDVILTIKAGDEVRATVTLAHGETASVPRLALTEGRWLYKLELVQVWVATASGTATLGIAASVNIQNADVYSHIEVGTTAVPLTYTAAETGNAPQKVAFSATGSAVTITATTTDASPFSVTQTVTNGTVTVDGLVLYRGGWLLMGRPATVSAATASGTATLGLVFRAGRL